MTAPNDAADKDAQVLASMSCCPTGALVVLGQVIWAACARRWQAHRTTVRRHREIDMLHRMWAQDS